MSNDHEWLNLIEVSGPFLAVPVLRDVFPQGLEALPSGRPQRLRRTYEEWRDAVDMDDLDLPALHAAWIDDVLHTALEIDGTVLRNGATLPERLTMSMAEQGGTVAPDLAVVNPTNSDEPLLLIHVYEPDTDLDATRRFDGLAITPADRMVALLRAAGCPTGIVTNGERWMLVHAPVGAVAGFASWYARLWGQEPETLRAFVSLLGVRRFFGPDEGKLPALYERSLKYQDDVTEALGEQVRRAVEVLVQALDRADQDRNRELLRDVDPRELYEAGLTVMMRLVFLLAAEERALLLLGDPRYDSFYAISSLRMQLRADSEEILERRRSAWSRLLALFRAVYAGIDHPTLRLPALGGSLFDPDRYPFLEGRKKGTSWYGDPAEPLPIDDRTVLLLLEAIQAFEGRTLSYRALDVEQIGHVYEGLLERTVKRVDDMTLELDCGAKAKSPRVTLGEMESARLDGWAKVAELLKERSERSESAIRNAFERATEDRLAARLLTVCRGDIGLRDRILPYAWLLRTDPWGYPLVHHKGAFVVVLGADRRESGTHYTPKSLTKRIVEETLTPIAYRGPAEGKAPEEWELKSAEELLDLKICDPAMGSGAFLVQACRWLSDRLVEAWSVTEAGGKMIDGEGRIVEDATTEEFDPLSHNAEERVIVARRLVAERCLYGVDKNPLAVELAKLSLWLTTMSKGRPFGFLDHNLRSGDSLLGIHDIRQLTELNMVPTGYNQFRLFGRSIQAAVEIAIEQRVRLRAIPIRDIHDVDAMAALDSESRKALLLPRSLADAFVGIILAETRVSERADRLQALEVLADAAANGNDAVVERLRRDAVANLRTDAPDGLTRDPFHWPLEFPEVFSDGQYGFNAIIGNPPFRGGLMITRDYGFAYTHYLKLGTSQAGATTDLCAYFFRRAVSLIADSGTVGIMATNSISEGDTRAASLEVAVPKLGRIFSAETSMPWPGSAALHVSIVHFIKGDWQSECKLDGKKVNEISSNLEAGEEFAKPYRIKTPVKAFLGTTVYGKGFFLEAEEAASLLSRNQDNSAIIRPFLNGEDVLGTAAPGPSRFVLCFQGMRIDEVQRRCPEAYELSIKRIYPERQKSSSKARREKWWLYTSPAEDLYREISALKEVFVTCFTSKYIVFERMAASMIFSNAVIVVASDSWSVFGLLQSQFHETWVQVTSSTLETRQRYALSDCFYTFPFPAQSVGIANPAEAFYQERRKVMQEKNVGLTKLMNDFHNPSAKDAQIYALRDAYVAMNRSVALAYGWADLDMSFDFHQIGGGSGEGEIRFSVCPSVREDLLRRLSELNKRRHEGEAQGEQFANASKATVSLRSRSYRIPGQSELGLENLPQKKTGATVGLNSAAEEIVCHLRARRSWLSKSDILAHVDIPGGQWNTAINDLIERGTVERQGERRGARYRIVEGD